VRSACLVGAKPFATRPLHRTCGDVKALVPPFWATARGSRALENHGYPRGGPGAQAVKAPGGCESGAKNDDKRGTAVGD
jgi:hypothetical protein